MKQTLKIIAISAMATAAVIKSVPALAEPQPAANISVVETGDLDLTTAAGRQALDHRLVVAAREVCGTASDVDLVGQNKARECRADVLASARTQSSQLAARNGPIQIAARR